MPPLPVIHRNPLKQEEGTDCLVCLQGLDCQYGLPLLETACGHVFHAICLEK